VITIRRLTLIILIVCLGLVTSGCSPKEEISSAQEVDLSEESKIIEAFGLIKAEESKDIIIDFPAIVNEVHVKEGQYISFEDPIFTLDLSEYESQITSKKNELTIAQLEQQSIEKNLRGLYLENSELEIDKLTNDLNFSEKLYQQALNDLQSYEKLYKEGAISQQELNQFIEDVDDTKNKVHAIEYELEHTKSKMEQELEQFSIKQDLESDQLNIQKERIMQIENSISVMNNKLNRSYIKQNQIISDFNKAVIYDITYSEGNVIDPTNKAYSIMNLESLIIEANVVEEFIRDVQVGSSVRIVPIADRTKDYTGKVLSISKMAFQKNGETIIPIRISIDDKDEFLMPNYNVDVFIEVQ